MIAFKSELAKRIMNDPEASKQLKEVSLKQREFIEFDGKKYRLTVVLKSGNMPLMLGLKL